MRLFSLRGLQQLPQTQPLRHGYKVPCVMGRAMTQMRGEQCAWSRECRGAEAKAVKGERPAPPVGKSREHLRARLGEKLPERQQ